MALTSRASQAPGRPVGLRVGHVSGQVAVLLRRRPTAVSARQHHFQLVLTLKSDQTGCGPFFSAPPRCTTHLPRHPLVHVVDPRQDLGHEALGVVVAAVEVVAQVA